MAYKLSKTTVWVGDYRNQPGNLARVLEGLAAAGAALEFMVARRVTEITARVFVAPLRNAKQRRAALDVGLVPATSMHCLRIEGPDRVGLGALLTRALAGRNINIRGASAAALGRRTVLYFAFAQASELTVASAVIRKALRSAAR